MIIKKNVKVCDISWLKRSYGGSSGVIGTFYEPESKDELLVLCKSLYKRGEKFDVIGYTSNIYFLPDYHVNIMVSTRKVNKYFVESGYINAECGVSVRKLSRAMVQNGVRGFEGLIDLPGTVAASVFNNSSCYECSINNILESFDMLCPNGNVVTLSRNDLQLSERSSVLKRGQWGGVILSVRLIAQKGNAERLKEIADNNQAIRKKTQPGPQDNLGSIYHGKARWTKLSYIPRAIVSVYGHLIRLIGVKREDVIKRKRLLLFSILGAREIFPYIDSWNRFIWKDKKAHRLFWKYNHLHRLLFSGCEFEIEIKGKIP